MLIIGHRGAAGTKPENTIEGLRAGREADVDMLEFDVRLTKDGVPILIHDMHLWRSHNIPSLVKHATYDDLQKRTANSINPIATLDAVLSEFGGKVSLNLELKDRGSASKILPVVQRYIKKPKDWELFLFSSFSVRELRRVRAASDAAQLALLQWYNPLLFLLVDKKLHLSAVGFHRLHINALTVTAAKNLGLFVYAYTVNRPDSLQRLADLGVDGVVTDLPLIMRKAADKLQTD